MDIRKRFRDFRDWCPQPPDRLPTKLKRYSMPIAAAASVTLILSVSLFVFSSSLMPSAPIVPLVNEVTSTPSTLPSLEWNKTYAGIYDVNEPSEVIQTSDGGYLMAGTTYHKYVFPVAWLVKTDGQGNIQWNQTLETIDGDLTYYLGTTAGIAQTSDGGYVIAGNEVWFNSTFTNAYSNPVGSETILFKLDSSGNQLWNRTYSDGGVESMVQTRDGGYAIAGNGFFMKTTSSGALQFSKTYTNDTFISVVQTNDGGYALLTNNNILFKINSVGNIEWYKTIPTGINSQTGQSGTINAFIQTSDGGFALVGKEYIGYTENSSAWLVKTNSKGTIEWNQTYGQPGFSVNNLIQTSDAGYALIGIGGTWYYSVTAYYAPSTAWLVKTDANGNMQWNLTVQGTVTIGNVTVNTAWVYGNNVIETKDGGFAIACTYDSSGEFIMTYFYLVKTEPALLPPTPTPTLTPVTNLNSNTLLVVIGALVAVVIVASVLVLMSKKKLKTGDKNGHA